MDPFEIIKKLFRNWKPILIFPSLLAILVFLLTINQSREYKTNAELYTGLASGFSITKTGNERADYTAIQLAFDNLLNTGTSRVIMNEVVCRLMAQHIHLDRADPDIIKTENWFHLQDIIPDTCYQRLRKTGGEKESAAYFMHLLNSPKPNFLKSIVNSPYEAHYGIANVVKNLKLERKGNSDVVEITYSTDDAGICYSTINLYLDAFSSSFKGLKLKEARNVSEYFQKEVDRVFQEIKSLEQEIERFLINKKIINYDEETKYIAHSKSLMEADFVKEKSIKDASKQALLQLTERLGHKKTMIENNKKLNDLRHHLTELNVKIAEHEINGDALNELPALRQEAQQLEKEIAKSVSAIYKTNYTEEGLGRSNILDQWLEKLIAVDESEAKLKVYENRFKEFDSLYVAFAPVGSVIKRLERQIEISEQEYLELLHSLNMAKLNERNLEISNAMEVLTYPIYPVELPTKRKMLVIGSFVAGVFMFSGFFILSFLLDNRIRSVKKIQDLTSFPILGAMPDWEKNKQGGDKIDLAKLLNRISSNMFLSLHKHFGKNEHNVVSILSYYGGVGKTWLICSLIEKILHGNKRVLVVLPKSHQNKASVLDDSICDNLNQSEIFYYDDSIGFELDLKLKDLIPNLNSFDYVFVEYAALEDRSLPVSLINESNLSLLVIDANQVWHGSDKHTTTQLKEFLKEYPLVVLNKADASELENLYGEIHKKRSQLRRWAKGFLRDLLQR